MSTAKALIVIFVSSVLAVLVFAAGGPVHAAFAPPRKLSQVTHTFQASVPPPPPSPVPAPAAAPTPVARGEVKRTPQLPRAARNLQ